MVTTPINPYNDPYNPHGSPWFQVLSQWIQVIQVAVLGPHPAFWCAAGLDSAWLGDTLEAHF